MHEGTFGGHLGEEKTLNRLKERYYGPGHYSDVQHWCADCAARKSPSPRNRACLTSIKVGEPLQLVAIDILGTFPCSKRGNSYILVAGGGGGGDYFTRWMEAYAIENQEAVTVARVLSEDFFLSFLSPATVALRSRG